MNSKVSLRAGIAIGMIFFTATCANAQRQMENLGRGVVAVRASSTNTYVGWRMLGTDPGTIGFNLYRSADGGAPEQLTTNQTLTTDYVDYGVSPSVTNAYFVRPVINGVEQTASASFVLPATAPTQQYLSVPLQIPPGGTTPDSVSYTYSANDCSTGDLDGDGEYEIIVKWDPSNSQDNANSGYTGDCILDAYKLDGTRLWRINLGKNIRAGAHYTQFMVYDLDGDGKAELACKTAPGTVDGQTNNVIMPGDNPNADYRNSSGYILTGPEYLTIFNGQTGAAMVTTNYVVPRGTVSSWGDSTGNRVDRFLACVAYLDGQRPSLVMCRGYYTRAVLAAWDWRNGQLTQRWVFDTNSGYSTYTGQGNHNLSVGDVDGDGKDEIVYGACAIDDNGAGLYRTGWGHGDAGHLSDMDPDRPGLEVWQVHESASSVGAGSLRDARTGQLIFGLPSTGDTGRGCAASLIPTMKGYQMWSSASGGLYNNKGKNIGRAPGSCNFLAWWDADTSRELLDGNHIDKYGTSSDARLLTADGSSNNGTKSTPCLSADLFGDWREEVIWRASDNSALRIYTTVIPAANRFYTFMHDPQYRLAIAWQNVAYNQPPHPGFYVGYGMAQPPVPLISTANLVWQGDGLSNMWDVTTTTNWLMGGVWTTSTVAVFNQSDSVLFDLSGSNNVPINLVGDLAPGAVTVYAPKDYAMGGSGSLTGTMALVKAGIGVLTINTTNNTYTGATTVSDGTLMVNGSLDQSPVAVRGSLWGLGRIGGSGRLGGGLTVQNGASVIVGSGTNVAGALTISNGMSEAGSVVNYFDLSNDPTGTTKTNDLIVIQGDLTLSGQNPIRITMLDGNLPLGSMYPLFQYSGTLNGGVSNFAVGAISSAFTLALTNPPGQIAIMVISNRAPTSITWAGDDAANVWDTGLTANWLNAGNADNFYPLDNVLFDDTGSTAPAVYLTGTLNPASVTVTATVDYTFSGTGSLTSPATIVKSGPGNLFINTLNSSTNRMTILGGTVQLGDGAAVDGSWSGPVSNNATFVVANTGALSMPGNITGSGSLTKSGAGALTLTGTNAYSGTTIIQTGTLQIGAGSTSGTLGTGDTLNNGALIISRSDSLTYSGVISGAGSFTKSAGGTLTLAGNNSYGGGTTVNGGYFRLTHNNAAGTGSITCGNSVQLGNGITITNTLNASGSPDNVIDCPSGTAIFGGNVVFVSGSAQFRPGTTGGTLILSNGVASMGSRFFIVPRGTVIFAGSNTITASSGIGFGRSSGNSALVTMKDNASISMGTCALGCGQTMGPVGLVLSNSAQLTLTAANSGNIFDLLSISSTSSSGTVNLVGGTLTVGSFIKTSTGGSQPAYLRFNGGVLKAAASTNVFLPVLTGLSARVAAGGAKIDDGGYTITISQSLLHDAGLGAAPDGGLTKLGAGTLILTGTNNYSGVTTVSNGTLLVNNAAAGSGTSTSAVSVVSGATLGGSGTIRGAVTIANGAALAPGNGVGTLTISNNLVLNNTSVLQYQLGSSSDRTAISGSLTLDGTLNVTDAGGFGIGSYTLFTYPSASNLVNNSVSIGTAPSGYTYAINTATAGQVKLDVGYSPVVAGFGASPTNGVAPLAVTFTDSSSGVITNRFWDFGDGNTTNTTATSLGHTYAAGTYTVSLTVSGPAGVSASTQVNLITALTQFQAWQQQYFGCMGCPQAAADADPDGDGLNNEAEFLAGTDPTNGMSGLRIISTEAQGDDVLVTWLTAGGRTNAVQATAGDVEGGYETNFTNISGPIEILGTGDVTTNYLDVGGVTNSPSRYYRIRLVP